MILFVSQVLLLEARRSILNNEIVEAEYKSQNILPIFIEGDDKVDHGKKWRTYTERNSKL